LKGQFLVPIITVILLAFLCANFVYEKYRKDSLPEGNVYFIQQGVYSNKESIKNIAASYITIEQDNKFYTYVGMTTSLENAEKIKKMYEKKNMPIYIKSENIQNQEFLNELSQYDVLLQNTEKEEEVTNILETILSTYEEILKTEWYLQILR